MVVEFGAVAPLMFLVLFASIEFGRMLMVYHGLESAARAGCREAVSVNATEDDVRRTVADHMRSFGIRDYSLTTDPTHFAGANQWDPISLSVEVRYEDVSWLPVPRFIKKKARLIGSCTLPKEAEADPS